MPIQLEIVTPERLAYSDTVDSVVLPGSEGELGVLPHHAPLVAMLGVGELRIRKGGSEESFAIAGGFLQVRPDKVVVMAETADLASDIDLEKAQEARREAGTRHRGRLSRRRGPVRRSRRPPAGAPADPRRGTASSRGPPASGAWRQRSADGGRSSLPLGISPGTGHP
ncbi:MAG: ATP synthase F1 subunit epsilon [Candidatus Limnocylindrales bacterium]